jgi:hypothetical protein
MKIWKPDRTTYEHIQKLQRFVDFVIKLDGLSKVDKDKAIQIKSAIANIDKQDKLIDWYIGLALRADYFSLDVKKKYDEPYVRTWNLFYEFGRLEIEAESTHESSDIDSYSNHLYFYALFLFTERVRDKRIYMHEDLDIFVDDAINYKSYITDYLNDFEIDIDIDYR